MIVFEFLRYLYPARFEFLGLLSGVGLVFTERARAQFVCDTVLLLLECYVC